MRYLSIIALALLLNSCSKSGLDETVYSSLSANNYYKNEADANSLLNAAYSSEQLRPFRNYFVMAEIPTGTIYDRSGGLEALAKPFENFTWDATHSFFSGVWTTHYTTVYRANLVLDKVPDIDFDSDSKNRILAEARFLRASAYIVMHDLFGPVPLITSSSSTAADRPSRADKESFDKFITSELSAAADALPATADKGRATKGAAWAQLAKYYLNLKDWANAAAYAQKVIELNVYELYSGSADRSELFNPLNENNKEFIYIRPHLSQAGLGDNYISHAAPPNYRWQGGVKDNYATQFKTYTSFYNSFADKDTRKNAFITEYYNNSNQLVKLGTDDIRNFKFKEDLTATGPNSGNDFPVIRYADILLSRAEALNETAGPSAEAFLLLNQVRAKAGLDPVSSTAVSSKDAFRTVLFQERTWEFVAEELHRQDMIRQGTFISGAKARGVDAKDYQVLYPIPQAQIDINPNLAQNQGYAK